MVFFRVNPSTGQNPSTLNSQYQVKSFWGCPETLMMLASIGVAEPGGTSPICPGFFSFKATAPPKAEETHHKDRWKKGG